MTMTMEAQNGWETRWRVPVVPTRTGRRVVMSAMDWRLRESKRVFQEAETSLNHLPGNTESATKRRWSFQICR
jgi:hypothetical protein